MPSPPQSQDRQAASHMRDSWPPTQLRMQYNDASQSKETIRDITDEEDESNIDPIIYFLSPTPQIHPADSDPDFDMDIDTDLDIFSAGIIDASHPPPTVRSISPSSLTGLALPPPQPPSIKPTLVRPPTPPRTPPSRLASPDLVLSSSPSSVSDDDEYVFPHYRRAAHDDDGEDYIRLGGVGAAGGMLRAAAPWMRDASSVRARRARAAAAGAGAAAASATRGRALARFGPAVVSAAGGLGAAGRGRTSGRRSPRAWREPSPEVWDIQEETEEEVREDGEMEMEVERKRGSGKRVRFVLPDREE